VSIAAVKVQDSQTLVLRGQTISEEWRNIPDPVRRPAEEVR